MKRSHWTQQPQNDLLTLFYAIAVAKEYPSYNKHNRHHASDDDGFAVIVVVQPLCRIHTEAVGTNVWLTRQYLGTPQEDYLRELKSGPCCRI
jgi:hypothetical protein